jgi:hypothetical protein
MVQLDFGPKDVQPEEACTCPVHGSAAKAPAAPDSRPPWMRQPVESTPEKRLANLPTSKTMH